VRSRVKGLYVTGMCAVAAPPPADAGGGTHFGALGFGALRQRAPPHDLVFVGTPSAGLYNRFVTTVLQQPFCNNRSVTSSESSLPKA
jgi:hypothetical protein